MLLLGLLLLSQLLLRQLLLSIFLTQNSIQNLLPLLLFLSLLFLSLSLLLNPLNQEYTSIPDDPWFGKVYSRRNDIAPAPMHIHDSDPSSIPEVTILPPPPLEIKSIISKDLPITIRKGSRECIKIPLYPLSNYVSFHNFSSSPK